MLRSLRATRLRSPCFANLVRTSRSQTSIIQRIPAQRPSMVALTRRFQSTTPTTQPNDMKPPLAAASESPLPKQEVKKGSRKVLLLLILAVPAVYFSSVFGRLNREYPLVPPPPENPLFQSLDNSRYAQHDTALINARIPISALLPTSQDGGITEEQKKQSYAELWTTAFLSSPTITNEAKLLGWLEGKGWVAGETGENGFKIGQKLINGAFSVKSIEKDMIVAKWNPADKIVAKVERWSVDYNLPFRIMSGGRHTFEVHEDGDSTHVIVSFGCGHDYERVNRANGVEDGKRGPRWLTWSHQMYARWLMDAAVQQLKKKGTAGWD